MCSRFLIPGSPVYTFKKIYIYIPKGKRVHTYSRRMRKNAVPIFPWCFTGMLCQTFANGRKDEVDTSQESLRNRCIVFVQGLNALRDNSRLPTCPEGSSMPWGRHAMGKVNYLTAFDATAVIILADNRFFLLPSHFQLFCPTAPNQP